jgi:hypothetical protein
LTTISKYSVVPLTLRFPDSQTAGITLPSNPTVVGVLVGHDGSADGTVVGWIDGFPVGIHEGCAKGTRVGWHDGSALGKADGLKVGISVAVGSPDG